LFIYGRIGRCSRGSRGRRGGCRRHCCRDRVDYLNRGKRISQMGAQADEGRGQSIGELAAAGIGPHLLSLVKVGALLRAGSRVRGRRNTEDNRACARRELLGGVVVVKERGREEVVDNGKAGDVAAEENVSNNEASRVLCALPVRERRCCQSSVAERIGGLGNTDNLSAACNSRLKDHAEVCSRDSVSRCGIAADTRDDLSNNLGNSLGYYKQEK